MQVGPSKVGGATGRPVTTSRHALLSATARTIAEVLPAQVPNGGVGRCAAADHVAQRALDLIDARRVTLLGRDEHLIDELPDECRVVVRWICSHRTSRFPTTTRTRRATHCSPPTLRAPRGSGTPTIRDPACTAGMHGAPDRKCQANAPTRSK